MQQKSFVWLCKGIISFSLPVFYISAQFVNGYQFYYISNDVTPSKFIFFPLTDMRLFINPLNEL